MLQIKSLYPMSNYARVTHEFLDDKITVKVKSLTAEYENEVKYENIRHIQLVRTADLRWITLGLFITMLPGITSWIFPFLHWNFMNNPPFPIIGRLIIAAGIALCIPAFRRNQVYFFMDSSRKNIVSIKMDGKNKSSLKQAVELVKQKSQIISETNPETPFPPSPLFEYYHYDLTDMLNKSVAMFYENNFMFKDSSLAEEGIAVVNYDELSGKVIRLKSTNNRWSWLALNLVFVFASVYWATGHLFPQLWQNAVLSFLEKVILGSAAFLFLLSFSKEKSYCFTIRAIK